VADIKMVPDCFNFVNNHILFFSRYFHISVPFLSLSVPSRFTLLLLEIELL
jgi:hypothetical protein